MATFLDFGLASHFQIIFTVLLVFVIIFAVLEKSKLMGENKGLHSLIALSVAMMMLFVPGVTQVVAVMAPWFVLIFLLVFFFLFLLLAFGTKTDAIVKYASSWDVAHWFFLVIGIIIFVGSLGHVYGGSLLPYSSSADQVNIEASDVGGNATTDTGDFNANVGRVIFHPKTLGMVFLLMVGALAVKLLTVVPKLPK